MPLQQIALDQSIYNKKPTWGANFQPRQTQGGGFAAAGGNLPNSFVERQKAEWAAEDKAKKAERDMKLQQAQEVGMRVSQQVQKEDTQQQQQQLAIKQQIESNPEPAAKEMYELMKTSPDDVKQQLLTQLFTPTSSGSIISGGGKTIQMAGKYNPIANVFLEKGWAMFDPKGNVNLSEPEREFEKGTFSYNEKDNKMINTATGEQWDVPSNLTGVDQELIADAYNYGSTYMGRLTEPTLLEKITPEKMSTFMDNARNESQLATMNYLLGQGVGKKEAKDIAYSIPFEERGTAKEPIKKTGRTAPLDEEKAKGLAEYLKANPNANLEAYRDRDGDATVDRALEIMGKKTEPTTTITKPTKKEEIKEELKVKDYFKGFPNLPYYP